jgi:HK97 gp10 family phage protein
MRRERIREVVELEFSGIDNLNEIFEKLPGKYAKKPVVATLRKAANIFIRKLRANSPKKTGETKKAIRVKSGRGISISAGFFASGNRNPKEVTPFFKAYWKNYGTLSNRSLAHKFVKQRKPATKNWKGGIRATGFVEESWEQTKDQVQQVIETDLKTETEKFLNKYAVK